MKIKAKPWTKHDESEPAGALGDQPSAQSTGPVRVLVLAAAGLCLFSLFQVIRSAVTTRQISADTIGGLFLNVGLLLNLSSLVLRPQSARLSSVLVVFALALIIGSMILFSR